ncbi:ABC transporter ATP-binding protein [Mucilaginibacter sp. dw_454]|uniref:ABC transporter ATP-binding protein n=1 Tax=Mucilaginibacter sp. dw_454 TaxID=2720079 RepID=UPI0021020839|nr:ABC transporter ATP-binding protein [Mucilaginibacter sp. dw_454]
MSITIKVENLSKVYQLGNFGTGTLSRDLERYWSKIRGKDDPFLKIGEVNDRAVKGGSDMVWSLKDISFDIQQGDAVGIIGRNGAGKSTLLKILSRITAPTTGTVKVRGRIASLLEVGTGFHPELTGRENIFLNGAILGMRKKEITRKFDEIVDFAGVERYIDTPVKRYSSGMYVRLAFAVAAHLESEILIVDEVLSVGDAEFQKKCLGKMGDVSRGEGRTVLFVSHNMATVKALCNKGIVLNNGQVVFDGGSDEAIFKYSNSVVNAGVNPLDNINYLSDKIRITEMLFNNSTANNLTLSPDNNYSFDMKLKIMHKIPVSAQVECRFYDDYNNPLAFFSPGHYHSSNPINTGETELQYKIRFPDNLNNISFYMSIYFTDPGKEIHAVGERILSIEYTGYPMQNGHVFEYAKGAGLLFLKPE